MRGRIGRWSMTLALTIGFQILMSGTALAHWPNLRADAVCVNGIATITFTATSWLNKKAEGENPKIAILFNGTVVAYGALKAPTYTFSGSAIAPAGTQATVTALAIANWGDGDPGGQSAATTVDIPEGCGSLTLGRITGGGSQIRLDNGIRVSDGLTIHCDLQLSNNLEVNWNGHKFHMLEHIQTVACTDDPAIIEAPPEAPLDTIIGVGVGRYDNVDGYTIEFKFVDAGEPGTFDMAQLLIYLTGDASKTPILSAPLQYIKGGNLQAHFDQPHK